MTTNKQIIIDGVDVSGCGCFSNNPEDVKTGQTCWYYTEYVHDNEWGTRCPEHPNCEYKQLQRKTAECEELQKLCQNQAKTINDLTGCVGLWEEFSEEESGLAKNSSIADLVVLLREARSSLESKTSECEELKTRVEVLRKENNRLTGEVCDILDYAVSLQHNLYKMK